MDIFVAIFIILFVIKLLWENKYILKYIKIVFYKVILSCWKGLHTNYIN